MKFYILLLCFSVTLQWTYRDGKIVNLPWALLVKDDIIVLRPGQITPADCSELNGKTKFHIGETYGQSTHVNNLARKF